MGAGGVLLYDNFSVKTHHSGTHPFTSVPSSPNSLACSLVQHINLTLLYDIC
jgi:hypothetical protein